MAEPIFGEIVGADFIDRDDGRITIHVAAEAHQPVGKSRVVILDQQTYRTLTARLAAAAALALDRPTEGT